MKILFVVAKAKNEFNFHPIGIGYLIAALVNNINRKFKFKVITKNIEYYIKNFAPNIVCITSCSQNYNIAKQYAKLVKRYHLPVIIGGVHISLLPHTLTKDMDIGIVGEGEKTIVEVVEVSLNNQLEDKTLKNITGIVYYTNDRLILTNKRELTKNLDEIAHPIRDYFHKSSHTILFSSRGCIYNCGWCASNNMWGNARFFSASYIADEIEQIYKKNMTSITIADYIFTAKKDRIEKIIKLLERKNLRNKIKFFIHSIPTLIDNEVAQLLTALNVKSVSIPLISGSNNLLKKLGDTPYSDIEVNKQVINTLKRYKINTDVAFTIGNIDETREDIMETIKFIKKEKVGRINIFLAIPQPGSKLWEYAKEKKIVNDDINWDRLMPHKKDKILICNKLTEYELNKFYYRLKIIAKIINFFYKIKNLKIL